MENVKVEWITHRKPTKEDAINDGVFVLHNNVVWWIQWDNQMMMSCKLPWCIIPLKDDGREVNRFHIDKSEL